MSAASSATLDSPLNVSAFIMMHGGVDPDKHSSKKNEYILSASPLPPNTQLFAPSILGYSYYDHQDSDRFIHAIHENYMKKPPPRPDYIFYCLDKIRDFEKIDVARHETALAISGATRHPPEKEQYERAKRLTLSETAGLKSRVEWHPHQHYITQKTYSIDANDKPQNSIMFFCEEDLSAVVSSEEFKQKFNNYYTKHPLSPGKTLPEIYYKVSYDPNSHVFTIKFVNLLNIEFIPFSTIHQIILNVVSYVLRGRDIHLSMFDFTCSEMTFPPSSVADGNETIFISSEEHSRPYPTLVYGTIPKDRFAEMKRTERGQLPFAYSGSPSPKPRETTLRSFMNVGAAAAADTLSPPRAPSDTFTINLLDDVESFVDFKSKFENRSRSVSPVLPNGGTRQSSHRRTRRHPRVGKKVSIRHGHRHGRRRRRGTKGRSRRNTRKRGTKN
jgi:hypothetical protein